MSFPWLERGAGTPEKPFGLLVTSDSNLEARFLGLYNLGLMDQATRIIESHQGDERSLAAKLLKGYVFANHPSMLDLPPNVTHRLKETIRVVTEKNPETGMETVRQVLIGHYRQTKKQLDSGFLDIQTITPLQSREGKMRIKLPSSILARTKVANQWMLNRMNQGEWLTTFDDPVLGTIAAKLGDANWLLAGSFMFELVQGSGRAATPEHHKKGVWKRWQLDFDDWYLMTHIIDSGLNKQLQEIGVKAGIKMVNGEHLDDKVYVLAYPELLQLIRINPDLPIKGVLSEGSWVWDRQLMRKFPRQGVSRLAGVAGDMVDLGPLNRLIGYPAQIGFATGDRQRRAAFQKGRYMPHLGARFLSVEMMQKLSDRYLLK